MNPKNYELIEHTADIGIKVRGKDLRELFSKAALAVFDILAERKPSGPAAAKTMRIRQVAASREELFINWLNELLSLSSAKQVVFVAFKITALTQTLLVASAIAEPARHYVFNTEIKAATYHRLLLARTSSGWLAEVILDV